MIKGLSYDINWCILEAAKEEGSEPKDRTTFYLKNDDEEINTHIEKLREEGYIIFHVFKSVGVVDDIAKVKSISSELLIKEIEHRKKYGPMK